MLQTFLLEYWLEDDWYIGRPKGIPGVFSQGKSLGELEENFRDAYNKVMEEEEASPNRTIHTKEIGVEV
jgi:predicted RNase H-like HicB family nuclease